jgi:predicted methyltransferase
MILHGDCINKIKELDDISIDAIVGTAERFGMHKVVLYDTTKCIDILMKRDKMTEEEAIEFFYYNVIGSWVGEYTPCFSEVWE